LKLNIYKMSIEYKIDDIKKLLLKIENLKDKKSIQKIRDIIFKENPDISITKKSSGTLLFFHNLTQNTYKRIDTFFNKLDHEKISSITATISDSYDKNLSDANTDDRDNILTSSPKIKLSNAEKKIIKKKEYHKQIANNSEDVYISDDDVFLGK
jgi:hypothetical protein